MKKIKKFSSIVISIFFVFAVIFSVVKLLLNNEKVQTNNMTDFRLYTISSNLVGNYSTYYYLNSCFENVVQACKLEEYDKLYSIYMSNYTENASKDEIIKQMESIRKYANENKCNFNTVYYYNGLYIVKYELNSEEKYMLFDLNNANTSSYIFAFLK